MEYVDKATLICSNVTRMLNEGISEDIFSVATDVIQKCNTLENLMREYFGKDVVSIPKDEERESAVVDNQAPLADLCMRNHIDACFIHLHHSILEILFHASKVIDCSIEERREIAGFRQISISESQARADRILATLSHLLSDNAEKQRNRVVNWADSSRLMWALRLIAASPVLEEGRKRKAEDALGRTGYEIGLMQGLGACHPTFSRYSVL